jgi:hypothetical protein
LGFTFDKSSKFSHDYEQLLDQATLYQGQPYSTSSIFCEISYKGESAQQFFNGYESYAKNEAFGDNYAFGCQKPAGVEGLTPILYDFSKVSWDLINNPYKPHVNHMEAICGEKRAFFTSYTNCHKEKLSILNIVKVTDLNGKFHHKTQYIQN